MINNDQISIENQLLSIISSSQAWEYEILPSADTGSRIEFIISDDKPVSDIETELENIALESYETIFNGRLAQYEEEADFMAMVYALRAGYDYSRLPDLLQRLYELQTESTNEHYSSTQIADRITALEINIKKLKISHKIDLMDKKYRWENMQEKLK